MPRGVPDQYKLTDQIAAGWESLFPFYNCKQKCGSTKLCTFQYPAAHQYDERCSGRGAQPTIGHLIDDLPGPDGFGYVIS